ncbi:MAG: DedA family protein [Chloroflexi bacterium]|nr:MAG: DedA family protein [Chloroflexota bacterium]
MPIHSKDNLLLSDVLQTLTAGVEQIVDVFGLPGIALVALLENLFPPTPSEFLYPLAGKLAHDGQLVLWGVVIAGVAGSLIGSMIYYSIGYWLGEARTRQAVDQYGRFTVLWFDVKIVTVEDFDRAIALFQRRGGIIVLLARILPLVHGVISIPAGVTRMRLLPFLVYTAVGSALWIAPLALLGHWLGSQWETLLYWLDVYQNFWYLVFALAAVYVVSKRLRARQHSQKEHYHS